MGWQVFIHSVRLVWTNLGVALRISAVLYGVSAVIQIWAQMSVNSAMGRGVPGADGMPMMDAEGAGIQLISAAVSLIVSLWIAVAWHRYILLEEEPQGFLPQWHGGRMAAYFGRSILIGLSMVGVILVAALPVMMGLGGALGSAVLVLGFLFAVFVFYRLCAVLPSIAVGEPITFAKSWHATEGTTGTIAVLVVCMFFGAFALTLPAIILGSISPVLGTAYMIVAGWFMTMFGVSILTTFYGHFVEKRGLG